MYCTYPDMRRESINVQTDCQIRSLEIGQGHKKAEMARAREAEPEQTGGDPGGRRRGGSGDSRVLRSTYFVPCI